MKIFIINIVMFVLLGSCSVMDSPYVGTNKDTPKKEQIVIVRRVFENNNELFKPLLKVFNDSLFEEFNCKRFLAYNIILKNVNDTIIGKLSTSPNALYFDELTYGNNSIDKRSYAFFIDSTIIFVNKNAFENNYFLVDKYVVDTIRRSPIICEKIKNDCSIFLPELSFKIYNNEIVNMKFVSCPR